MNTHATVKGVRRNGHGVTDVCYPILRTLHMEQKEAREEEEEEEEGGGGSTMETSVLVPDLFTTRHNW